MAEERQKIDVTRTVANYAIVLLHAWAAQQYAVPATWEYRVWDFVCNAMTAIVLPALFLISGYLMMRNFRPATYGTKICNRVKRLLIPYVTWNVTFVMFYLCIYRFVPRMRERVEGFGLTSWQGAFDKVLSFMTDPIDMPTWFMRTLMLYAIFSLPLWFLLRRWRGGLAYSILVVFKAEYIYISEEIEKAVAIFRRDYQATTKEKDLPQICLDTYDAIMSGLDKLQAEYTETNAAAEKSA